MPALTGRFRSSGAERPLTGDTLRIREVWAENLEQEMAIINEVVEEFNYLAMDTEFPGVVSLLTSARGSAAPPSLPPAQSVGLLLRASLTPPPQVARPMGTYKTPGEYQYQTLRCNVDMLKLIQVRARDWGRSPCARARRAHLQPRSQLGLTFCDANGALPLVENHYCAWQFNFREFNVSEDMYAQDSIELLRHSGIDFKAHLERGIDVRRFGELLMVSGVVLSEEVRWITFHSSYDFGYLLKLVTCRELPATEGEFFEVLLLYFPFIFDMKYLMKFCEGGMHGGLQKLADVLEVERIGPQHQAGSDALLTATTFFKLRATYFRSPPSSSDSAKSLTAGPLDKYINVLYGLGVDGKGGEEEAD